MSPLFSPLERSLRLESPKQDIDGAVVHDGAIDLEVRVDLGVSRVGPCVIRVDLGVTVLVRVSSVWISECPVLVRVSSVWI